MEKNKFSPSKSQIDKAGQLLSHKNTGKKEQEKALEILSDWRAHHANPLSIFAKSLKARVKQVSASKHSIVAQRLKRTPSILLKLQVHKTMRLSTMQDIGGLRAILDNPKDVYALLDLYRSSKTRNTLFSFNDYIEKPKNDGYRGVHLVYKISKSPNFFLEIQMRSHLQHIWATGVEVFGTLQKSSFKSGQGEAKWLELFGLLSSVFALKEDTPCCETHKKYTKQQLLTRTKHLIHELKIIEQLNVYTNLYKVEPLKKISGRSGNYSLISLNSQQNTITVQNFATDQIEEASKVYIELEKKYLNDTDMNVVLVNSGDIKKLALSYPNYFMDAKTLLRNLSLISIDQYI